MTKWRHEKIPLKAMPQFFEHRVVCPDGWRFDLLPYRSDGEGFVVRLAVSAPTPGGLMTAPATAVAVCTELDVHIGEIRRLLGPVANLHLGDWGSPDVSVVLKLAQGARAMIQAVSDGIWDVQRFVVFEGWTGGDEDAERPN
ncbi:MAG: hypothetical protein HY054_13915 [Proteobacteria bacterium]|nr:hypothetical protein [Pseudomonadota bacterium]